MQVDNGILLRINAVGFGFVADCARSASAATTCCSTTAAARSPGCSNSYFIDSKLCCPATTLHAIGIGITAIAAIAAIFISRIISPAAITTISSNTTGCLNNKTIRRNQTVSINVPHSACSTYSTVSAVTGYYRIRIIAGTGIAAIAGSASCSSYCNITIDASFYCTVSIKNTTGFSRSTCISYLYI